MMKFVPILVSFILFFCFEVVAEVRLRGRVVDDKGVEIPYATLSIPSKHTGTLADSTGTFSFKLRTATDRDSIIFSSVGYEPVKTNIGDLKKRGGENIEIILAEKPFVLKDVVVVPPKAKSKTFGRTSMTGKFELQIGSEHPEGCGVGVRCKVGKRAWITKVSMGWIQREGCVTRMPFRLNTYTKENGQWVNTTERQIIFTYDQAALDENERFTYVLEDPLVIHGDTMIEFEFLEPMHGNSIYIKSNIMAGHFHWHEYGEWENIPVGGSFAVHALVESR